MTNRQKWPQYAIDVDDLIQRIYPAGTLAGVEPTPDGSSLNWLWVEVDQKTPEVVSLLTRELRAVYGDKFDLDFWTDGDKPVLTQQIEKIIHRHEPEGEAIAWDRDMETGKYTNITVHVPRAYFWLMRALEADLKAEYGEQLKILISTPMDVNRDS